MQPRNSKIFNEAGVAPCLHPASSHLCSLQWGNCCGGGIATSSQPVHGVVCARHQEGLDQTPGRTVSHPVSRCGHSFWRNGDQLGRPSVRL